MTPKDEVKKDEAKKDDRSVAQIEADLAARRAELADTIDRLTAQLDPRANLAELKAQLAETAANASEETQEFITRLQRGERGAQEALGFAAAAVVGLAGLLLLRRGR